jgi:hypothetical protein
MMTSEERQRLAQDLAESRAQREAIKQATRAEPIVIDFPFPGREPARSQPRCCRLGTDGRQCESPATHGDQCLRHYRWFTLYSCLQGLPLPEDPLSLQEVLEYTVEMVLSKRTTADEARAIAELCHIMEKNLAHCEQQLDRMADAARPKGRVTRLAAEPHPAPNSATLASK